MCCALGTRFACEIDRLAVRIVEPDISIRILRARLHDPDRVTVPGRSRLLPNHSFPVVGGTRHPIARNFKRARIAAATATAACARAGIELGRVGFEERLQLGGYADGGDPRRVGIESAETSGAQIGLTLVIAVPVAVIVVMLAWPVSADPSDPFSGGFHAAPERPFTVAQVHDAMQVHRECGAVDCPRKEAARTVLVQSHRMVPDSRGYR